jgi:TrmH family RNA methyltransferase
MKPKPKEMLRAIRVPVPRNLRHVRVILCEPQTAGNIGSAARAMQTMGITDLVVINGCQFRGDAEAVKLAHGALDILESARVVASLSEATEGLQLLVGTSHRARCRGFPEFLTAREAASRIASVSQTHHVGILFGREDSGLTNDELGRCQLLASIPAARRHPSLNLAQAVMVFCYEIFQASVADAIPKTEFDLADVHDIEALHDHIMASLKSVGFRPYHDDPESFIRSLRRVFARTQLEKRDIQTLHRIFAQFDSYVRNKE